MDTTRSAGFKNREHGRYWWFSSNNIDYVPPIFSFLTEAEWQVMDDWYSDSEKNYVFGTGECNVPAMSMLMGLLMGNNVGRIVQCGHFIGFSTLLIGFMLRRMNAKHRLFSVDINPEVTAYTQSWIDKAGLQDQIRLVLADSSEPRLVGEAASYLGGKPQLLFIDSSHERNHTLAELDLWVPALQPGGFAVLHDVSQFARQFDGKQNGGVQEAVQHFSNLKSLQHVMINDFCDDSHYGERTVYKDACGLGIIQVPS